MKAHELLARENGWCQGIYSRLAKDGTPQFCLMGALSKCYQGDINAPEIFFSVRARIGHDIKLECWNDTPGRTQAEVVALLKELDI